MDEPFAAAVRARRAELRAAVPGLSGGHRTRLRTELTLVGLEARQRLGAGLAIVAEEGTRWIAHSATIDRSTLPAAVQHALSTVVGSAHAGADSMARTVVLRVAGRALAVVPGVLLTTSPARREPPVRLPDPPRRLPWWRSACRGSTGVPRLLLVLTPSCGVPVAGGRGSLPLAVGLGVAGVVAFALWQSRSGERERWRRWLAGCVEHARLAAESELTRLLLLREQEAAETLDAAIAVRRAAVEAELRALGPSDAP